MTGKIKVLVGCKVEECASEFSYPLEQVRMLDDKPICETCYDDGFLTEEEYNAGKRWDQLPPVTMQDLCE